MEVGKSAVMFHPHHSSFAPFSVRLAAVQARLSYRQLRHWHKGLRPGSGAKEVLLAALRAAHTDFLTSASVVPIAAQTTWPVCGWWTVKELFGHLADWDILWLNCLKGEGTAVRGIPLMADEDAFNGALQTSRAQQTLEEVTADFAHTRHLFLAKVESLSQETLERPSTLPTLYPTLYQDVWATVDHYLEHAAGLRQQLNMPLSKWLRSFNGPYT